MITGVTSISFWTFGVYITANKKIIYLHLVAAGMECQRRKFIPFQFSRRRGMAWSLCLFVACSDRWGGEGGPEIPNWREVTVQRTQGFWMYGFEFGERFRNSGLFMFWPNWACFQGHWPVPQPTHFRLYRSKSSPDSWHEAKKGELAKFSATASAGWHSSI